MSVSVTVCVNVIKAFLCVIFLIDKRERERERMSGHDKIE